MGGLSPRRGLCVDYGIVCGIFGVASPAGTHPAIELGYALHLRDMLEHRGPDSAGIERLGSVLLGHRRLAVRGHDAYCAQPMRRFGLLAYNGEIYNTTDLRDWRSCFTPGVQAECAQGDTSLLAELLAQHGVAKTVARLRGMYAFAWVDAAGSQLTLARDTLGIKPLYYARCFMGGMAHVAFASEIAPLAELLQREGNLAPDYGACSAYLTTIRTTLHDRTLFEGIRTVLPGQVVEFQLRGSLPMREARYAPACHQRANRHEVADPRETRRVVEDSIRAHLVSDVPLCCLLSGGLDSTIVTAIAASAAREAGLQPLATYSVEAVHDPSAPRDLSGGCDEGDGVFAEHAARAIGTGHQRVVLDRSMFVEGWRSMVMKSGMPLSTPNEVAIRLVARVLKAEGHSVALSGEGADELFCGYAGPMEAAKRHIEGGYGNGARFSVIDGAWVTLEAKQAVVSEAFWSASCGDSALLAAISAEYDACGGEGGGLETHLRLMQSVNLGGLLRRLDSAMMLEGVEGRTPFADATVAAFANALPLADRYQVCQGRSITKACLRSAFADVVPVTIMQRAKASFPLPFIEWLGQDKSLCAVMGRARAREAFFSPAASELVGFDPSKAWSMAWPMMNLGLWAARWWGERPTKS